MTIAPRSAWEDPKYPVTGPAPRKPATKLYFHWPGSDLIPDTFEQTCAMLRQYQVSYLANRKYSLGYSWAISRDGFAIEVRGDQFNNAANAGKKVQGNANDDSRSILIFCGVDSKRKVTPQQVAAVHELIREKGYVGFNQKVHSDVDWTSCAGPDITVAVRSGVFKPEPLQPPVEGEDDMVYLAVPPSERTGKPWLYVSGSVRPATTFDINDGVTQRNMDDIPKEYRVQQYDDLYRAAGLS